MLEPVDEATRQQGQRSAGFVYGTAVLLTAGLFLNVLLIPAIALGIAAFLTSMKLSGKALLVAACLFAALTIIGIIVLALNVGKLDYGLAGYTILFTPFIAASCAISLFTAYSRQRSAVTHRN